MKHKNSKLMKNYGPTQKGEYFAEEERERVLIVDDSTTIREIAARTLESKNYEVITAEDGHMALDELAKRKIDLVITDILMPPPIDGFELVKLMKTTPAYEDIPVIVLTSERFLETQKKILEIKPDASFLTKPFTRETLTQQVEEALGKPGFINRDKVTEQEKKPEAADKEIPNKAVEEKIRAYEELFQEIWNRLVPVVEIRVITVILNKVSLQITQKYPILQYLEIYTGRIEKKVFDKMTLGIRPPSESTADLSRGFKIPELVSLEKLKKHTAPEDLPALNEAIKEFLVSFADVAGKLGTGIIAKDISDKIAGL